MDLAHEWRIFMFLLFPEEFVHLCLLLGFFSWTWKCLHLWIHFGSNLDLTEVWQNGANTSKKCCLLPKTDPKYLYHPPAQISTLCCVTTRDRQLFPSKTIHFKELMSPTVINRAAGPNLALQQCRQPCRQAYFGDLAQLCRTSRTPTPKSPGYCWYACTSHGRWGVNSPHKT